LVWFGLIYLFIYTYLLIYIVTNITIITITFFICFFFKNKKL